LFVDFVPTCNILLKTLFFLFNYFLS